MVADVPPIPAAQMIQFGTGQGSRAIFVKIDTRTVSASHASSKRQALSGAIIRSRLPKLLKSTIVTYRSAPQSVLG